MNAHTDTIPTHPMSEVSRRVSWLPGARAAGFAPMPEGEGERLHRIGMALEEVDGWATLSHPTHGSEGDAAAVQMGRPGLWRRFASGRAEFDFPPREALGGGVDFERLLDWALVTADGRSPGDWHAPPECDVRAAAVPGDLVARVGAHAVRGEIARSAHQLSVVFPRVLRMPKGLGDARRAWIAAITDDAQRRWRLVRIGPDATGETLGGEVDLTGVPAEVAGAMVALAAASLRTVIEWVLPPLRLAADPTRKSEILEHHPDAGDARGKD